MIMLKKKSASTEKTTAARTYVSPPLGAAESYVGYKKTSIVFYTPRTKPLSEVTGADVPLGLDPEDVATDYAPLEE